MHAAAVRQRLREGCLETPKPGDAAFARSSVHLIATPQQSLEAAADQFSSNYIRDLLAYDPSLYVPKIKVPFLAMNGSKDLQVEPKQNLGGFRKLLANNKDATFVELPGLNHLLQTVTTGGISEYSDIDETFAPVALDTVSDWIVKRMKP